jgi:hypothetical protein
MAVDQQQQQHEQQQAVACMVVLSVSALSCIVYLIGGQMYFSFFNHQILF